MKKMLAKLFGRTEPGKAFAAFTEARDGKWCILVPQRFSPRKEMDRTNNLTGMAKPEKDYIFLSNMGNHFQMEGTHQNPANMFTPLDDSVCKLFIGTSFPVLYANDFTAAWLGSILINLGEGGELWIEIPDQKANRARNRLTIDYLAERLPALNIKQKGDWFEISAKAGLAEETKKLKTIYPFLLNLSVEFRELWAQTFAPASPANEPLHGKALSSYIYSLFGANQKSFVFQKIIDEHLEGKAIKGLDLGAGYGFLACELAMQGHNMTALDYDGGKLETVGKWLLEQAGLQSRVKLEIDSIENLPAHEGAYDAISFFGSLLAIAKNLVPEVLSSAMRLLRPGGVLLVHENPKEIGVSGTLQYEDRFEAGELLSLLKLHAGEPRFYSPFNCKPIAWSRAKRGIIMAVVQKKADQTKAVGSHEDENLKPCCGQPSISEQPQHNMVFITGGDEVQTWVYQNLDQGYWSAGFHLVLEKNGYLDFDIADHGLLAKPDQLAQYDLAIVSWLPEKFWQPEYLKGLKLFEGALFLEGPYPKMVLDFLGLENRPAAELEKSLLNICSPTTKKLFQETFSSFLREGGIEIGPKEVFTFGVQKNRWEPDIDFAHADFGTLAHKVARSYVTSYMHRLRRNTLFPKEWDNSLLAYVLAKFHAMGGFGPEEVIKDLATLLSPALSQASDGKALNVMEAAEAIFQGKPAPLPPNGSSSASTPSFKDKMITSLQGMSSRARFARDSNHRPTEELFELLSASLELSKGPLPTGRMKSLLTIVEKHLDWSTGAVAKAGLDLPSCCLLAIGLVAAGKQEVARSFLHRLISQCLDTEKGFVRNLSYRGKTATLKRGYCLSPLVPLAMLEALGVIHAEPYFGNTLVDLYGADLLPKWAKTPLGANRIYGGPGVVEAQFSDNNALPISGIIRNGNTVTFTFSALSFIVFGHTMHPIDRPFSDYRANGVLGLNKLFFHLLEEQIERLNLPFSKVEPWPWDNEYCLTIRHDVDRIPEDPVFNELLQFHQERGLGVSWYWIPNRLKLSYLNKIQSAKQEIGLHYLKHESRDEEIAGLAQSLNKQDAIHGGFAHGGGGGDNWLGHPSVAASKKSGLAYTEGISTHYGFPYRFPALRQNGTVCFEDIICLAHTISVDRNIKGTETRLWNQDKLNDVVDNGFYFMVLNHPDKNPDRLRKLVDVDLEPKTGRLDWTAQQVADWWRKTHCKENLSVGLKRSPGGALVYQVESKFGIQDLVLSIALPGWSPGKEPLLPEGHEYRITKKASGLHWLQVRLNLEAGKPVDIEWPPELGSGF